MAVAYLSHSLGGSNLRLRYWLLLALALVGAAKWGGAYVERAWEARSLNEALSDYAECMVGPGGDELLRSEPSKFWLSVRRRLVVADGLERPFAMCSQLAKRMGSSPDAVLAYTASAADFQNWSGNAAGLSLDTLRHSVPELRDSGGAWPFSRSVGRVVRSKPVAVVQKPPSEPGEIRGLAATGWFYRALRISDRGMYLVVSNSQEVRAFRSRDHGLSWVSTSPWQTFLSGTAHRCMSGDSEVSFSIAAENAQSTAVRVHRQEEIVHQSALPEGTGSIRAMACDAHAAVLLTSSSQKWDMWLCGEAQPCRRMPDPRVVQGMQIDGVDIARYRDATIVAITQGGLVRVFSTRDDGLSFMPLTVAMDWVDSAQKLKPALGTGTLVALDDRILLVRESATEASAVAVSSKDLGASWGAATVD